MCLFRDFSNTDILKVGLCIILLTHCLATDLSLAGASSYLTPWNTVREGRAGDAFWSAAPLPDTVPLLTLTRSLASRAGLWAPLADSHPLEMPTTAKKSRRFCCCFVSPFWLSRQVLFFGTRCERLCMTQFALVSLVPHLLESLQDCASVELDTYTKRVSRATKLRTSERSSCKSGRLSTRMLH